MRIIRNLPKAFGLVYKSILAVMQDNPLMTVIFTILCLCSFPFVIGGIVLFTIFAAYCIK